MDELYNELYFERVIDELYFAKEAVKCAANIEIMNSNYFGCRIDPMKSELFLKISEPLNEIVKEELQNIFSEQLSHVSNIIIYKSYPKLVLLQPKVKLERNFPESVLKEENIKLEKDLGSSILMEELRPYNVRYYRENETGEIVKKTVKYEPVYIEAYNTDEDFPAKDEIIDRFTNHTGKLRNFYGEPIKKNDIIIASDVYYFDGKTLNEISNFYTPNLINLTHSHMDVGVQYEIFRKLHSIGKVLGLDLMTINYFKQRYDELRDNFLLSIKESDLREVFGEECHYENCYSFHRNNIINYLDHENIERDIFRDMKYLSKIEFSSANDRMKSLNHWLNGKI